MKRLFQTAAAVVLSLALPAAVHGQVVTASNPASLVSELQTAGYPAQLAREPNGTPAITSAYAGTPFIIYFYDCSGNANCATVMFSAKLPKRARVTHAWLNDWNARKRFTRAYLNRTGEPRLEMDLDLGAGGMSRAMFRRFIGVWVSQLSQFNSEVNSR